MIDFERLFEALSDAGVEFILVGGVAATVHGSARLTQDIDVVYARAGENLERLVAALAAHGPYLRGAPLGLCALCGREAKRSHRRRGVLRPCRSVVLERTALGDTLVASVKEGDRTP